MDESLKRKTEAIYADLRVYLHSSESICNASHLIQETLRWLAWTSGERSIEIPENRIGYQTGIDYQNPTQKWKLVSSARSRGEEI